MISASARSYPPSSSHSQTTRCSSSESGDLNGPQRGAVSSPSAAACARERSRTATKAGSRRWIDTAQRYARCCEGVVFGTSPTAYALATLRTASAVRCRRPPRAGVSLSGSVRRQSAVSGQQDPREPGESHGGAGKMLDQEPVPHLYNHMNTSSAHRTMKLHAGVNDLQERRPQDANWAGRQRSPT